MKSQSTGAALPVECAGSDTTGSAEIADGIEPENSQGSDASRNNTYEYVESEKYAFA